MSARDLSTHALLVDADGPPRSGQVTGEPRRGVNLDPLVLWGLGFVAAAALAFLVGWFGVARNNEEWRQLPILISAGGAGALLLTIGSALFGANEHRADRAAIARLLARIDELDGSLAEIRQAQEAMAETLRDLAPRARTRAVAAAPRDREAAAAGGNRRGS